MKIFTILACLLLTTGSLFAQYDWTKGEIFLKNGETKKGIVKLPVGFNGIKIGGSKIKFKTSENQKPEKIKEKEVERVVLNTEKGEVAEFRWMPRNKRKKALFHVINDGKTKLYARQVSSGGGMMAVPGAGPGVSGGGMTFIFMPNMDYNEILVLKAGDKKPKHLLRPNVLKSFRRDAMKYFNDCPSLVQKLKEKIYGKDDLKQIVEEYNNCK